MNTALAPRDFSTPTQSEFQIMLTQSQMLVKTGFLPQAIKTPEQALAIMLTGRELGIPTMAALNTINVIQGKPTVSPQLMLALIERSGQLEDIVYDARPDAVSVTMKRRGRTAHTETFGKNEASAMQLTGKDNYKRQAAVMYKWRAVAACARVCFPDVILGLYTPEEMGAAVSEEGEIIADNVTQIKAVPAQTPEDAEREELLGEIRGLFKALKANGDSLDTPAKITDFINDYCEVEGGMASVPTRELPALREELELRLETLVNSEAEAVEAIVEHEDKEAF